MSKPTEPTNLYDVVAVNIKTGKARLLDTRNTIENAEAFVKMAVMRRGVDEEFYKLVLTGTMQEGDKA